MSTAGPQVQSLSSLRICVVCDHPSLRALTQDPQVWALWAAEPTALIELRLDGYGDLGGAALVQALEQLGAGRCLLTYRSEQEGGLARAPGGAAQRLTCLRAGLDAGAFGIDVEIASLQQDAALQALWRGAKAVRLASWHKRDAVAPLAQLQAQQRAAEALGADVVKIVVAPKTIGETQSLLDLVQIPNPRKVPLIALATGLCGLWSRLLCGRFVSGAPWTYAALPNRAPVAAGQLSWQLATQTYRVTQVGPRTPVYGVVGTPIGHSRSPALHNGWLAQAGQPGIYVPLELADDLAGFLARMAKPLGLIGLSVTHPFKQAACAAAVRRTQSASATGAVNTLWRVGAHKNEGNDALVWHGDNTDVAAAVDSLERLAQGPLKERVVVVLGAGGAAHAVAYGAHQAGARVRIWARRRQQAQSLAHAVGGVVLADGPLGPQAGDDALVVNCTPVGMAPTTAAMVAAVTDFGAATRFFDTVYAPEQTAWLLAAQAQGHATCNGMAMLEHQARAQFARFMSRDPV